MTQIPSTEPTPGRRLRITLYAALPVLLGLLVASPARAQSLSAGALTGSVRDIVGQPLSEADVSLVDDVTGQRRGRITHRTGEFSFELLLPGDYTVLVQRFGYRPRMYRRVPVRAGARINLDVVLQEGAPEAGVDTVAYPGVPAGGAHIGLHADGIGDDLADLADALRTSTGASSILPGTDGRLDAQGLPGRLDAIAVDGVTRSSARHIGMVDAGLDGAAFPLASVRSLEMLQGGFDAEWPGSGGGVLGAFTVPGARTLAATGSILGGPDGQTGSLLVSGPVVRDTAQFAIGVSASRVNSELAAPWRDSAMGSTLALIAQDSFQTDLTRYQNAYKPSTTLISAFGRFDWLVAADQYLSVRASAASAKLDDPTLGDDQPPTLGSHLDSRDVSVAASLTSIFAQKYGSELRVSVDAGNQEYTGANMAGTVFSDAGFAAGNTPLLPGQFKRTTFRVSETGHMRLRIGSLKAGLSFSGTTYDLTYADNRTGTFYFGDSTGFAGQTGAFRQTVGSAPSANFKTSTIGGFGQALLRPSPTLTVLLGFRADRESAPVSSIRFNSQWQSLTGIDNRTVPASHLMVSPRAAFVWSLGAARRWEVGALAGLFAEPTDPASFADAITHSTGLSIRRGNGVFSSWPAAPDSAEAPVQGQSLTLLGPDYTPPRTGRVVFGITGNMGGTILRIQGAYRHTDYLPLRRDVNLAPAGSARDQYGRQLYGTLDKFGGVLAARPGTNRRFAGFDQVSSLDPAAASDYYGLTLGLERDVLRHISLVLSYTYSRTTDNWFGARSTGTDAQFVPFADSTGKSTWADGTSDFDAPHRVVAGVVARVGNRARLAVLYRWRSGYPFTPGFRDGVDANGDGSARNDPAFVTDTVSDAAGIIGSNSCVNSQVGSFAERNSCRDPSFGALDLRLAIRFGRLGTSPVELLFDALGVTLSGTDSYDHALYLVDPSRPLVTAGSVTQVPLVVNSNFGQPLIKRKPDPMLRVGLRVGL